MLCISSFLPRLHAVTTTLTSDFSAASLTINSGDIFRTNGYDLTISSDIVINGELDLRDIYASNEGDGTIITLGRHWTQAVSSTFTVATSTVIFNTVTISSITGSPTFLRCVQLRVAPRCISFLGRPPM